MDQQYYPFRLEPLPYRCGDLAPYLDLATVLLHHGDHQRQYAEELNAALEPWPVYQEWSLTQLVKGAPQLPLAVQEKARQSAAGLWNHRFYFESMAPASGQQPGKVVGAAVRRDFGSLEELRRQFSGAAASLPASGWVWLAADCRGRLRVLATRDQENPLTLNLVPLLCADLWEHAYYLQYRSHRERYLEAWWRLADWERAESRYRECTLL